MSVTTNADQFSQRMAIIGERIERNVSRVARAAAMAIDAAVVTSTPVDKGRARSNWIASLNRERFETVEIGHAEDVGAQIAGYQSGDVIYLQNNLPYIGQLNRGHSAQAPAGFVERGVRAGEHVVRNTRLLDDGGGL